jgi:CBS domain-containing protein
MKVKELMTPQPRVCTPTTTVAAAAQAMWEGDCGILPVVDDGALAGVVTDRDMYIALATRNKLPSDLTVGEVATKLVITAAPEDEISDVLNRMKRALVRRLPVVAPGGAVVGIISLDDIVRAANRRKIVRPEQIVDVLQALAAQHRPAPPPPAAA